MLHAGPDVGRKLPVPFGDIKTPRTSTEMPPVHTGGDQSNFRLDSFKTLLA